MIMRKYTDDQKCLIHAIGKCLNKVNILSKCTIDHKNEVYWYTREACNNVARREGIFWGDVLMSSGPTEFSFSLCGVDNFREFEDREVFQELWVKVCHPSILIEDVMSR